MTSTTRAREGSLVLSAALVALLAGGCNENSKNPVAVGTDGDYILLAITPTEVGVSLEEAVRVKVTVTKDASGDVVKFTATTGGSFEKPNPVLLEVTRKINIDGEAEVNWFPGEVDRIVRFTATVTVTRGTVTRELTAQQDFHVTAADPDRVLRFVARPTSAPADNATLSAFTVEVAPNLPPVGGKREVTFTTTEGSFDGGTGDKQRTKVVQVNAGNQATALLKSPGTVTRALVQATIQGVTRDAIIDFGPVDPTKTIEFIRAPASAPADGKSLSTFTVRIPAGTGAGRTVEFKATAGEIAPNEGADATVATVGDQASIQLRSPALATSAIVQASFGGVSASSTINFVRALPDDVTISLSSFTVKKIGAETTITASLFRDIGAVTPDTIVTFEVVDAGGASLGLMREVTRSTDGKGVSPTKASAIFNPNDSAPSGRATVIIGVPGFEFSFPDGVEIID